MKEFLFFFFAALSTVSVFAQQCIPAPQVMGQPQRCWDGRYISQVQPMQQQVIVVNQQQVPYYPQGYQGNMQAVPAALALAGGFNRCETVGAVVGGTLGSFAKNHQWQAILLGGILGGIAGDAICYNNQNQQVLARQTPSRVPAQSAPPVEVVPAEQQAASLKVPGGDVRCPLRFNGNEVEVFFVDNSETCMKVVEYEARRRGWVRSQ